MAKAEVEAKVKAVRAKALEILMKRYTAQAEKEADRAAEKARKYFESQEEPDVAQFLAETKRVVRRGRAPATGGRKCAVCGLEGARNTFSGAKKKDHTKQEHQDLKAGKAA